MSPPCTLVERFWRLWQDGLFVKSVTCVASMSTIVSNPSLSATVSNTYRPHLLFHLPFSANAVTFPLAMAMSAVAAVP